jgi:hypothetical protein
MQKNLTLVDASLLEWIPEVMSKKNFADLRASIAANLAIQFLEWY